jgi:hypothetical protein
VGYGLKMNLDPISEKGMGFCLHHSERWNEMKATLVLLAMVFLGGCEGHNTQTQYLAVKDENILYPYGKISYSIQPPAVVAKVILYQKQYKGTDSINPGYLLFETKETFPDLVRLSNCTVYDTDNWEGDFGHLHIKIMSGKFVEPNSDIISVSFWQWNSITDPKVYSSGREWGPGTKHPNKHLVAADKNHHWLPEEGYEWVKDDENKVKRDADGYGTVKKIGEK